MGLYCTIVSDVSLGTSTAKTQLSGDRSGNATALTLNANCKGILAVQPYFYVTTPTANQTAIASLKLESDDLGIKDYEVLAPPIGGTVATTDQSNADLMRTAKYPVFKATQGGETVNLYGIAQIANTAAPNMGAQVWWTDDPSLLNQPEYRAKIGGAAGGAASTTSTGTATGAVTGATISLTGNDKQIRAITGIVAGTTLASVKPIAGYFTISSGEMAYPQYVAAEPLQGPLGTAVTFAHLTRADDLNVYVKAPSTVATTFTVTAAPSTAGNFCNGILYN